MDTSCRDCVFAEWDGLVQSGCEIDRLSKFNERGTKLEYENDGNKEYIKICGRVCNMCRQESTFKNAPARKWKKIAEDYIKVRCAMLLYIDDSSTMLEANLSLQSILHQTLLPKCVRIMINTDNINPSYYVNRLRGEASDIDWKIRKIRLDDADFYQSIDISLTDCETTYYSSCKAGYIYPIDYLETINKAINEELITFIALTPDDNDNAFFGQTSLHKMVRGNSQQTFLSKIQEIAEEESTTHMIKSYEELKQCVSV